MILPAHGTCMAVIRDHTGLIAVQIITGMTVVRTALDCQIVCNLMRVCWNVAARKESGTSVKMASGIGERHAGLRVDYQCFAPLNSRVAHNISRKRESSTSSVFLHNYVNYY